MNDELAQQTALPVRICSSGCVVSGLPAVLVCACTLMAAAMKGSGRVTCAAAGGSSTWLMDQCMRGNGGTMSCTVRRHLSLVNH